MWGLNWGVVRENVVAGIIVFIITAILSAVYFYRKQIFLLLRKLKLRIFPVTFNVAFSIESETGINNGIYYDAIKKQFKELVQLADLGNLIKVQDFSDIQKFETKHEAENFRNSKDIDLIIWGNFTDDRLREHGKSSTRININFTFGHPENRERRVGPMLLLDINSKLATKNYWNIVDDESKNDITTISNNIFDIASYTLGLALKVYGKIEKSLKVYEQLASSLQERNDPFIKHVIPHLVNNYNLLGLECYFQKNFNKAIEYARAVLKYDQKNFQSLANLALLEYKNGSKENAEKVIEQLYVLYPYNPITEVDVAFLRILQKKYSNALKHYKKFLTFNDVNFSLPEVAEFLNEEYKSNPEPALIFASAVVIMKYGDLKLAIEDFDNFLKRSPDIRAYKAMRSTATRLVGQCRTKVHQSVTLS